MTGQTPAVRRWRDWPDSLQPAAVARRLRDRVRRRSLQEPQDLLRLLADAPQAVPRLPAPPEDRLGRLGAASLALHAVLLLALLWHAGRQPTPEREISVELVQAPPPVVKAQPSPKTEPQRSATPQPKPQPQQHRAAPSPPRPAPRQASQTPGPMPVRALPGEGAPNAATDVVAYPQLVLSKLAKAKKQGRYMGVPGYAGVRFSLADDGSLASVRLVTTSGVASLDDEAIAMVKRAAPYPPPPPGGRRDYGITLVFEARP